MVNFWIEENLNITPLSTHYYFSPSCQNYILDPPYDPQKYPFKEASLIYNGYRYTPDFSIVNTMRMGLYDPHDPNDPYNPLKLSNYMNEAFFKFHEHLFSQFKGTITLIDNPEFLDQLP